MAITASAWPPSANFFAASGISKEPGTRTTAMLSSGAPEASSAPSAPDSNRSVMKLLKRLTTSAKRSPAAFALGRSCLGVNDSFIAEFRCHGLALLSMKLRRALFEERARAFPHVFRGGGNSEERRFEKLAFLQRHFDSALDRFHRELHGERRIGNDLFCQRLRRGQKLRRLINVIDETDAKRLIGRNHFSGQAQFVSNSLAAQAGKPLRPAIARENSKFYFGLPELGCLARETHRTGQRHFTSAAQRETVDRRDRGFSQRFQPVQDALPKQRGVSSAHRGLHRQFADVRSGDEGFFPRAGQKEHAHIPIFSRGNQNLI